ncbi:MAG: beta-lactamase family protein [Clostridia bacterium]|nr:beta-lactamase family protein [Clostridia bacterium]
MQIQSDTFFEDTVRTAMERLHVPGASYALVRQGRLVLSRCSGVQDTFLTPVQADTLFECASLTKVLFAFTALTVMDRLHLSLDIPVIQQVPFSPWSDDPHFPEITPRHCLSHTSGMENWHAKPIPMHFTPGSAYSYSGEGYYLLQTMLEIASGLPLDQLVKEVCFQPFHMDNARIVWTPEVGKRFSLGFDKDGMVCKTRNARRTTWNAPEPNAAWSLYSGAADYARFLCGLLAPEQLPILEKMHTCQIHADQNIRWGLGLGLHAASEDLIWHWGDNSGFQSLFLCDTRTKDAVVVITNSSRGLPFCYAVCDIFTDIGPEVLEDIASFIAGAE